MNAGNNEACSALRRTCSRGARSATWSTARSSVVLMCTPANILSILERSSATWVAVNGYNGDEGTCRGAEELLSEVQVEAMAASWV